MADDSLFDSARMLLDGAREDFGKFIVAEAAFTNDPEVGTFFSEMDPETGDKLIKLRFVKEPPKELWRLAHHIVNDLRHALDQAVFAACKRVLGTDPAVDVYFPFASHPNDLAHKLKMLPPALHAFLKRQQPYKTGNGYEGGDNILRLLGTLAGPNKHQVALGVGPDVNAIELKEVSGDKFAIPFPALNRAKNEVTLIRIFPGGNVNYNLFIPVHITLRDPAVGAIPFSVLFWNWWAKVREIIDTLDQETGAAA